MIRSLRRSLATFAAERATASVTPAGAARWHRLACAVTPELVPSYRSLVALLRQRGDRWEAKDLAQEAVERFPEDPDAWMLLGEAWLAVYRHKEALTAFEQSLALTERPAAALEAGAIYLRSGRFVEAAERFSRAYAAGGGSEALRRNAEALYLAGDGAAAEAALKMWAHQVPDGESRLKELREKLERLDAQTHRRSRGEQASEDRR